MSDINELLGALSASRRAVEALRAKHADVFAELDRLQGEASTAEARFKTAIRTSGVRKLEAHGLKVTVSHPKSKSWDAAVIRAELPDLERTHPQVFKVEVDKKELSRLVDLGDVPRAVADKALTVTERTPAVKIVAAGTPMKLPGIKP